MKHSFAPLAPDAVAYLSKGTGIDYSRVDFSGPDWFCVTARHRDEVVGVCVFEFRLWFDAYFTVITSTPRAITRRVLRSMFEAVFSQAKRVTTEIPDDVFTLPLAQRMGFEIEGYKRLAIDGRKDALQLGMTKDTCRYLRRAPRASQAARNEDYDGQHPESA